MASRIQNPTKSIDPGEPTVERETPCEDHFSKKNICKEMKGDAMGNDG